MMNFTTLASNRQCVLHAVYIRCSSPATTNGAKLSTVQTLRRPLIEWVS